MDRDGLLDAVFESMPWTSAGLFMLAGAVIGGFLGWALGSRKGGA